MFDINLFNPAWVVQPSECSAFGKLMNELEEAVEIPTGDPQLLYNKGIMFPGPLLTSPQGRFAARTSPSRAQHAQAYENQSHIRMQSLCEGILG
jgi:hypothetical protein